MFVFSNKTYDFLKKFVQIILPAFGALYFGLGQIWNFPSIEQVVGSISIVGAFLGTCLGISHSTYENSPAAYDGQLIPIHKEDGRITYSMEYNGNVDAVKDQTSVKFKVMPPVVESDMDDIHPDNL